MNMKPKTIPYGDVERDLCTLVRERVSEAIHSVMQIADTKEAKFLICIQAMSKAVAMCGGAYSAVYVGKREDPFEVAKVILDLAQKSGPNAGGEQ